MSYEDEIIAEQYFPYVNMSVEERNLYLNLIMNTKELCSSDYSLEKNSPLSYELIFLSLVNEDGVIRFDGAISNGEENRIIYGNILKRPNNILVYSDIIRCNSLVDEDEKEIGVIDIFNFKRSVITRKTKYHNFKYYEAQINLKTKEEMDAFLQGKVDKFLKR